MTAPKPDAYVLTCHLCPYTGKNLGFHFRQDHGATIDKKGSLSKMRVENAILQADEVAAVRAMRAAAAGNKPGRIHPDDRIFAAVLAAARDDRWGLVRVLGLNGQSITAIFAMYDAGELPERPLLVCA